MRVMYILQVEIVLKITRKTANIPSQPIRKTDLITTYFIQELGINMVVNEGRKSKRWLSRYGIRIAERDDDDGYSEKQ